MAHPGELKGFQKEVECSECKKKLQLRVCRSNAGYYLGYYCPDCGPYSRETVYYPKESQAETDLERFLDTGTIPNTAR
jgi:NAD-dependent SIR2 family protein deacetylase